MRTTVIPAQITTVEDKIAGNLNLTQILILMAPVFWGTLVYTLFLPTMHLAWYKVPVFLVVAITCVVLALRIKGKVVLEWIMILLKYNLRPKYSVFNKNDTYERPVDLPIFHTKPLVSIKVHVAKPKVKETHLDFSITDLAKVENLIASEKLQLRFRSGRKGGLNVAFNKIQK